MPNSNCLCLILVFGLILSQTCFGGKNRKVDKDAKRAVASRSTSVRGESSRTPLPKGQMDLNELLDDSATTEERRKASLDKICKSGKLSWFGENIGNPVSFSLAPKSDLIFRVAVGVTKAKLTRADILLARDEVAQLNSQLTNILIKSHDSKCEKAMRGVLSPHLRALFEVEDIFYIVARVDKFMSEYRKKLEFHGVKINREGAQLSSETTDRPKLTDLMLALEKCPDKAVTEDSIKQAIEEYRKLSQSKKDGLEVDPRLRLVVDFAILPAINYHTVPEVDKLIKQYNEFRPGYVEKRLIGEEKLPENSAGFMKLMELAEARFIDGQIGGEPTTADFLMAKSEYEDAAWKLNYYRKQSNIYDNLEELARVINLLNRKHNEIFLLQVYPAINHKMEPVETFKHFGEYLSEEKSLMIDPNFRKLGRVFLKLEKARCSESTETGLTVGMLEAARSEFISNAMFKRKFFDDTLRDIVEVFVLTPMAHNSDNNLAIDDQFIHTLFEQYRDSMPSYFEEQPYADGVFPPHIEYMQRVFDLGTGKINEKPTREDFELARKEYHELVGGISTSVISGRWNIQKNKQVIDQMKNLNMHPPAAIFMRYLLKVIRNPFNPDKLLEYYKGLLKQVDFPVAGPSGNSN